MSSKREKPARRNPVAKFVNQFNRATPHRDRTKYRRQEKHKGQEPFAVVANGG